MATVTGKDLLDEQERRLRKLRRQQWENRVDSDARSCFLEKPYYMTQAAGKNQPRQQVAPEALGIEKGNNAR